MQKKVPLVHLFADVVWLPGEFWRRNIPQNVRLLGVPADDHILLREVLKGNIRDFPTKVQTTYVQLCTWMVRMESNLTNRADLDNILNTRVYLLTQGIRLAHTAGTLFKDMVGLHSTLGVALKSNLVLPLCQCVEFLQAIRATFHRRGAMIGESISVMLQQVAGQLLQAFLPIKGRLEAGKKYSDAKLDMLAALDLALHMLRGNVGTSQRRVILKLCTHIIFRVDFLKPDEIDDIHHQMERLELLGDLERLVPRVTDCAALYWSRSLVAPYLQRLWAQPERAGKLSAFLAALRDAAPLLRQACHVDGARLVSHLQAEVAAAVHLHVAQPLCAAVETELRLHAHAHLAVAERNPWKVDGGLKALQRFFALRPLRLFDTTVDLSAHVRHYLDRTFYHYATVPSNTRTTYDEMRKLADEKYGLGLTDVHLPGQALEQGIDVLEIMRHIDEFVARFSYNLNNQVFIERTSDSKTLNSINITHIANSIRTHGIGIMNTTVNFIFQFLKQRFVVFSKFLYDDHIKSPLYRDIRFFKENRDQLDNKYPFDRAQKFNKEIRKLGLTEQKQSYLDQFRALITEIGNAMGYVRMIRSGGFQYVSNAIKFVPDLRDIVSFEELVTKEHLSKESTEAAKHLDNSIDALAKSFAEGTEYFQLLVSVFAEQFRNPDNLHLKNFYIIIPPLMINYVEHILVGKDRLNKRKGEGAFFTEDGFVIGVAYILKLLDQYKQWDSLHWFEEAIGKYAKERKKIQAELTKQRKDDQQTSVITAARLKAYQTEFELLRFSFDGARIFFNDK